MLAIGCIGEDDIGELLIENLKKEGCEYFLETQKGKLTSQCGVVNYSKERYLIPIIESSQLITQKLLENCLENKIFENKEIDIFFSEGFFALTSYDGHISFVDYFANLNKRICMSLSLVTSYSLTSEEKYLNMQNVLNKTNYVFCNINELRDYTLAILKYEKNEKFKRFEFEDNLHEKDLGNFDFEFVRNLVSFVFKTLLPLEKRIMIVTWNKHPVVYSKYDYETSRVEFIDYVEVQEVPKEQIVDTNGCGDGNLLIYLKSLKS